MPVLEFQRGVQNKLLGYNTSISGQDDFYADIFISDDFYKDSNSPSKKSCNSNRHNKNLLSYQVKQNIDNGVKENQLWTDFLNSSENLSNGYDFSIPICISDTNLSGDTIHQYHHSSKLMQYFNVLNPQILFSIKSPTLQNIRTLTRKNVDVFIQRQLRTSLDLLKQHNFKQCLFPLYQICSLLQFHSSSYKCYSVLYHKVTSALRTFTSQLESLDLTPKSKSKFKFKKSNSLHTALLSESNDPIQHDDTKKQAIFELWSSLNGFYYVLPRLYCSLCLLPLLSRYHHEAFVSFLQRFPSQIEVIAPSMCMLFYLAFYCHTFLSLVSQESSPASCSRPTLHFLECIQSCIPFTASAFSTHVCELLIQWLVAQSVQQESDVMITKQQDSVLCYLFDCSLKSCSNQCITSLITNISIHPSCYSLMKCLIVRLPNSYFQKNFKSVIQHVSKFTGSVSSRPSVTTLRGSTTVPSTSGGDSSSGSDSTDFNNRLVSEREKKVVFGIVQDLSPSDSCYYGNESEYEEKKELLLLVLQRINELTNVDNGDITLLNSLWKLLNTCYNRDYFLFIKELLPFVINHYSKREVVIVLNDIIQFIKQLKSSSKYQEPIESIMQSLIQSVRNITEYISNETFIEFMDCLIGDSHLRCCILILKEVFERKHVIEDLILIENLLDIVERGYQRVSYFKQLSYYNEFLALVKQFINTVRFGDNFVISFEFHNRCLHLFTNHESITLLHMKHLLLLLSQLLSPYLLPFIQQTNTLSVISQTTASSMMAGKMLERMQKQTPESMSIQDYQLVIKIMTVLSFTIPTLSSTETQLDFLSRIIDFSLCAGCLTHASQFISSYLQLVSSISFRSDRLNSLLDIVSRYTCLPCAFSHFDAELDPFATIKDIQSIVIKETVRQTEEMIIPIECYNILLNCVIALKTITSKSSQTVSIGVKSNYHYYDFDCQEGKEMIFDVIVPSIDIIANSLRKCILTVNNCDTLSKAEDFILILIRVFENIFKRNEALVSTISPFLDILQQYRDKCSLTNEQLATYTELSNLLYSTTFF